MFLRRVSATLGLLSLVACGHAVERTADATAPETGCSSRTKALMPCGEDQIGLACESAGYCPTHYFVLRCGYHEASPRWLETGDEPSRCPPRDASTPEVGADGCPTSPDIGGRPCTEKDQECLYRHLCPSVLIVYRCETGSSGGLLWNGHERSC